MSLNLPLLWSLCSISKISNDLKKAIALAKNNIEKFHNSGIQDSQDLGAFKRIRDVALLEERSSIDISNEGEVIQNAIERYTNAYKLALDYFINCIIKDIDPSPTLIDGRNSLAIAEALTVSAQRSNKIKVKTK